MNESISKYLDCMAHANVCREQKKWREQVGWLRLAGGHLTGATRLVIDAMDQATWSADQELTEMREHAAGERPK